MTIKNIVSDESINHKLAMIMKNIFLHVNERHPQFINLNEKRNRIIYNIFDTLKFAQP